MTQALDAWGARGFEARLAVLVQRAVFVMNGYALYPEKFDRKELQLAAADLDIVSYYLQAKYCVTAERIDDALSLRLDNLERALRTERMK